MPSPETLQFVRCEYDDRRARPWLLVWGEDHVLANFPTRDEAVDAAGELRGILNAFWDWVKNERS